MRIGGSAINERHPMRPEQLFKRRLVDQRLCTGVDQPVSYRRVMRPRRNQSPKHKPAIVPALVSDNAAEQKDETMFGEIILPYLKWPDHTAAGKKSG